MARFLLFTIILISLFTASLGYFNKLKLAKMKRTLADTQVSLVASKNRLAEIKKGASTASTQLSENTSKLQQTSANLVQAQEELKKFSKKITDLDHQLGNKDSQISALRDQLTVQENKFKELTATIPPTHAKARREAELTTALAEQQALVTQLQSQLERTQSRIQEYAKKDLDRKKLQNRLGLEGKILAVNHAWNFVVLSLGDRNGAAPNTEMLVKRGDRFVGKVRITSVEPSSSIADIVGPPKGQAIQPGDSVIYQATNDD